MTEQRLTDDERELLRALHFDRVNAWQLETSERIAAVERELVEMGRSYVGRHFASTETWCRSITERASDARAIARTPIRADWARRKYVARSIKSRGRFLAWYVPAMNARRASCVTHRVAADAAGALRYPDLWGNALVDIDRVGHDKYAVTPRDSVPSWDYLSVKPHKVPAVKPFLGSSIRPYGRLEAYEYREPYEPRSMVPSAVYEQSTADPMSYSPMGMRLLIEARDFLAEHGERMPLADVYDVRKHRWHGRPDRSAYRGKVRVVRNSPVRYQRKITAAIPIGADGQLELETKLVWYVLCGCHAVTREVCTCERRGWIGHRYVTFPRAGRRADRHAVKVARKVLKVTAAKGPMATAWTASDRSLPRMAERVADAVSAIESVLRTQRDGSDVAMTDGTVVTVIGAAQVFDHHRGRAYPIREWARRAALDGSSVA